MIRFGDPQMTRLIPRLDMTDEEMELLADAHGLELTESPATVREALEAEMYQLILRLERGEEVEADRAE